MFSCSYCNKEDHEVDECRQKKRDTAATESSNNGNRGSVDATSSVKTAAKKAEGSAVESGAIDSVRQWQTQSRPAVLQPTSGFDGSADDRQKLQADLDEYHGTLKILPKVFCYLCRDEVRTTGSQLGGNLYLGNI